MAWLVLSTFTAAVQRVFHSDPRIGFLSAANVAQAQIAAGQLKPEDVATAQSVVFNNQFDAALGGLLIVVVGLIVVESVRQWILLLTGRAVGPLAEAPRVPSHLAEAHRRAGALVAHAQ